MTIRVNMDGACNNKQENAPMGIGVAVFIDEVYQEELSVAVGYESPFTGFGTVNVRSTNNVAEWLGCIEAMRVIKDLYKQYPTAKYIIQSDSEVITYVFNGTNKTHQPIFESYLREALQLCPSEEMKIQHVRREFNKEADKLSKVGKEMATLQIPHKSLTYVR